MPDSLDYTPAWGPQALEAKRAAIRDNQARLARIREKWVAANTYFYAHIAKLIHFLVEPGRSVLHVRCQIGQFIEALQPARYLGVELSPEMVQIAAGLHPGKQFVVGDPERVLFEEKFDYVFFEQITDTVDVMAALRNVKKCCLPHTRLIIHAYNPLWEPLFKLADLLHLKMPLYEQNWLSENDVRNMLALSGYLCLGSYRIILVPKKIPFVSEFFNRFLARIPGINRLCMVNVMTARPAPEPVDPESLSVSVIIPAKNEEGNIRPAVERIPAMGAHTEIIFCDDRSTDATAAEVRRMQTEFPDLDIKLVEGPGVCKSKNVWTGFDAASGDVLMILDADLTVMPEELPLFFAAIASGKGEFINGSRLIYPIPKEAMKLANMLGNKGFSLVFSYLLNQRIKDTLCGTKVLRRSDWRRIRPMLGTWGVEDRWGDYELLFGADKLQLHIVDMPVHYQERVFGNTKMVKVFRNGLVMLRMCLAAFLKLKFGY
jgi:hypothetical protein